MFTMKSNELTLLTGILWDSQLIQEPTATFLWKRMNENIKKKYNMISKKKITLDTPLVFFLEPEGNSWKIVNIGTGWMGTDEYFAR